ncbi:NAD(P)/FAD-dependent oxidoreductase [uncultured Roseobacter sp.]|uniref:NAD(P)/FAD-dependent oxidoreductase n=1 Tax=uncultured Roseobacter sp. TaxID=114847 RepID=UPI00261AD33A|nr:NAD(P)-binding protein [uncultured Roseobacter sp.]
MSGKPSVAIIGAGLSGLRLAQRLTPFMQVTVFEKSRGLGGRMSTRRTDGFAFDHGAQYFTARSADFEAFLRPYLENGTVQMWAPRLAQLSSAEAPPRWTAPRYVATPGMTGLAKAMAAELTVHRAVQVDRLVRSGHQWQMLDAEENDLGRFDWVISTAPSLQTARLMPPAFAGHPSLEAAVMQGCYSLMLGFDTPQMLNWDAAWVGQDPLAWIAVNTSKPGRPAQHCIVAQTSNRWADTNLERDQDTVRAELISAVEAVTGLAASTAAYISLHRWRYASVATPSATPFLIDPDNRLAAAGDWCGAGKVEAAFDSASALAEALEITLTG